jgi:hypothetical protein
MTHLNIDREIVDGDRHSSGGTQIFPPPRERELPLPPEVTLSKELFTIFVAITTRAQGVVSAEPISLVAAIDRLAESVLAFEAWEEMQIQRLQRASDAAAKREREQAEEESDGMPNVQ